MAKERLGKLERWILVHAYLKQIDQLPDKWKEHHRPPMRQKWEKVDEHLRRCAYSDGFVQLFREIPSTCSEDSHPTIPRWIVHLIGAKRRWYFVIFQSYLY